MPVQLGTRLLAGEVGGLSFGAGAAEGGAIGPRRLLRLGLGADLASAVQIDDFAHAADPDV